MNSVVSSSSHHKPHSAASAQCHFEFGNAQDALDALNNGARLVFTSDYDGKAFPGSELVIGNPNADNDWQSARDKLDRSNDKIDDDLTLSRCVVTQTIAAAIMCACWRGVKRAQVFRGGKIGLRYVLGGNADDWEDWTSEARLTLLSDPQIQAALRGDATLIDAAFPRMVMMLRGDIMNAFGKDARYRAHLANPPMPGEEDAISAAIDADIDEENENVHQLARLGVDDFADALIERMNAKSAVKATLRALAKSHPQTAKALRAKMNGKPLNKTQTNLIARNAHLFAKMYTMIERRGKSMIAFNALSTRINAEA